MTSRSLLTSISAASRTLTPLEVVNPYTMVLIFLCLHLSSIMLRSPKACARPYLHHCLLIILLQSRPTRVCLSGSGGITCATGMGEVSTVPCSADTPLRLQHPLQDLINLIIFAANSTASRISFRKAKACQILSSIDVK